jgi:putative nucleotidyltransferase with HDIG domain
MTDKLIEKEQLCIGLYIHLDIPWMHHPFLTGSFKIRNQQQLEILRRLKISRVRVDPSKSDTEPLPRALDAPRASAPIVGDAEEALWAEKRRRIQVLKERRTRLNHGANRYRESVGTVRALMSHLFASPAQAADEADRVVCSMVDELTTDSEVTMQLVNMKGKDESTYYHVINVAALSLTLGKGLGLSRDQLRLLGLGALFHDLGHRQIPSQILRKKEPLTPPEQKVYQRHVMLGAQTATRLAILPKEVVAIIAQHHEHLDGSGYPKGLTTDTIAPLARIVAVVNRYDNLCNRTDPSRSLSPYEAVSLMYSKERGHYDAKILTTFITNLGVYPPGTVVKLTDGRIATVVSINPQELLRPNVLVFNPEIPKEEALILNLTEEDLAIKESCRRAELDPEVLNYLNLSESVNYYFERADRSPSHGRR